MKRTALSLITALSIAGAVQAQNINYLIENPDNKAYLGIRAGLDISSASGSIDGAYGNGAGFTIGAIYNIPLWKNLYFEPGVHIFYDTFKESILTEDNHIPVTEVIEINGSIRNFGFRIPLNAGYRFDFTDDISVSIFTGPVLNTNITAKGHYSGHSVSIMEKGFKRFDLQWDFGASMSYAHNYYVSVTGAIGITRAYSFQVDGLSYRRNTCNIAVGYNF